ncbi:enoyl-CoA hydratase/isomerase family protein [Pseudonocardia sp. GCM10023141]|uniref:enoyl-CoA hydratase/isomerase family protein n=1 Tax=Pseudonocardia sp. GCM10023141 TaxID=3252653 RepID=UPI003608E992
MTTTEGVRVEMDGSVRRIVLNRPRTLNALTLDDLATLHAALELPSGVRAVVFAGTGDRAFCAGMNVDTFLGFDPAGARAFIADLRALLQRVRTLPVPALCAVDGHCLGAAFELALACDLRIATDRAVFGLPEIKVGIPSVIDAALLQQYVGLSLAKEMILTGDGYPVARLAASGLCNAVVAPVELEATVERFVGRVSGHTRAVTASQKRLFELWQNGTLAEGTAASVEEFATVFAEPETAAHLAGYRATLGSR